MKPTFVRNAYNYNMNEASEESGLKCLDKTLAKQSFLEEVDINTIVRRFNLTGQLPENVRMPQYQDFEGIFDFHSAMNAISQADEAFSAMPANVRARFHNDPGEFVDFCLDPENRAEAVKLGLVERPAPIEPVPTATAPASGSGLPTTPQAAPNVPPAVTPT